MMLFMPTSPLKYSPWLMASVSPAATLGKSLGMIFSLALACLTNSHLRIPVSFTKERKASIYSKLERKRCCGSFFTWFPLTSPLCIRGASLLNATCVCLVQTLTYLRPINTPSWGSSGRELSKVCIYIKTVVIYMIENGKYYAFTWKKKRSKISQ